MSGCTFLKDIYGILWLFRRHIWVGVTIQSIFGGWVGVGVCGWVFEMIKPIKNLFHFIRCCCYCWYQIFNKKLIITQNSTHYKEFITVLVSLYLRMKKSSYITFFLLYIAHLLILCVISLRDSALTHSPSGKELNFFSQKVLRFSWHCTLLYQFHFFFHQMSLRRSTSSLTFW